MRDVRCTPILRNFGLAPVCPTAITDATHHSNYWQHAPEQLLTALIRAITDSTPQVQLLTAPTESKYWQHTPQHVVDSKPHDNYWQHAPQQVADSLHNNNYRLHSPWQDVDNMHLIKRLTARNTTITGFKLLTARAIPITDITYHSKLLSACTTRIADSTPRNKLLTARNTASCRLHASQQVSVSRLNSIELNGVKIYKTVF